MLQSNQNSKIIEQELHWGFNIFNNLDDLLNYIIKWIWKWGHILQSIILIGNEKFSIDSIIQIKHKNSTTNYIVNTGRYVMMDIFITTTMIV